MGVDVLTAMLSAKRERNYSCKLCFVRCRRDEYAGYKTTQVVGMSVQQSLALAGGKKLRCGRFWEWGSLQLRGGVTTSSVGGS